MEDEGGDFEDIFSHKFVNGCCITELSNYELGGDDDENRLSHSGG